MPAIRLVTLGDSIVAGGPIIGNNPNWTQILQSSRSAQNFAANNAGVGGYTVDQTQALWDASYRGRGYTHGGILVGTNPLASGSSAASVITSLTTLVQSMRTDGLEVFICTIPPRGGSASWDATKEARRVTVNDAIRDMPVDIGTGVVVVDIEAPLSDGGSPPALTAATDSGDHLHPNGTPTTGGHPLIAAAVNASVPW